MGLPRLSGVEDPVSTIRTAVPADLPELQRIFRSASLSNPGDAPLLLARPEFLQFTGEGVVQGRTRVAVTGAEGRGAILGFATVTVGDGGEPELEDAFVDPRWRAGSGSAESRRRVTPDAATTGGGEHLGVGRRERRPCCFDLASCTDPNLAKSGRLRDVSQGRSLWAFDHGPSGWPA